MNIYKLSKLFLDTEATVLWLQSTGLIQAKMNCPLCGAELTAKPCQRTFGRFRCQRAHDPPGPFSKSVTANTWFSHVKMPPEQVILLTYAFATKMTTAQAIRESSIVPGQTTSDATVADWFSYCREVCIDALARTYETSGKIGGPGHTVEIDECKIGRRKYHRGRVVEGTWILGLIDIHTKDLRLAICPDNKRDKDTLLTLINKHVEKGTTIHTDCWKGYAGLTEENFTHLTVNHQYQFVDPDTSATTNHIESQWRPLRHRLTRGGIRKENLAEHLAEYLWRADGDKNEQDPFDKLLSDIAALYH